MEATWLKRLKQIGYTVHITILKHVNRYQLKDVTSRHILERETSRDVQQLIAY